MSKSQSNRQHHNNFAHGRGVFACEDCGRQTRGTADNLDARTCSECYELAGLELTFTDYGADQFTDRDVTQVRDLLAKIDSLGGFSENVRAADSYGMYAFVDAAWVESSPTPAAAPAKAKENLLNLCYNADGTITLYLNGKKHQKYTKVSEASAAGRALGGHWGVMYDRTKK